MNTEPPNHNPHLIDMADEYAKAARSIPLKRLEIHATADRPLELPGFPGGRLRGAFGQTLRAAVCVTGRSECKGCPVHRNCAYTELYEPTVPGDTPTAQRFTEVPRPYVVHAPLQLGPAIPTTGPEAFHFGFTLIGSATRHVELVSRIWTRLLERGLTPRVRTQLIRIETTEPTILPPVVPPTSIRLEFHTPLRLQQNGAILRPDQLEPRRLVTAMLRRLSLLYSQHRATPALPLPTVLAAHAETLESSTDLHRVALQRFSHTQKRRIPLDGLVGNWTLSGDLEPILPLLQFGEHVHIGKNVTHGHGAYRLVPVDSAHPR